MNPLMGNVLGKWFDSESSWLKPLFVTLIMLLALLLTIYFIIVLSFVLHNV